MLRISTGGYLTWRYPQGGNTKHYKSGYYGSVVHVQRAMVFICCSRATSHSLPHSLMHFQASCQAACGGSHVRSRLNHRKYHPLAQSLGQRQVSSAAARRRMNISLQISCLAIMTSYRAHLVDKRIPSVSSHLVTSRRTLVILQIGAHLLTHTLVYSVSHSHV